MMDKIALGLDYGTNSVRALAVNVETGDELATAVFGYPSGEAGLLLDPSQPHLARQHPSDYLEGFVATVRELGSQIDLSRVIGIGVDTTGSSPMPVDAQNRPLADRPEYRDHLHAQVWLWKDHTSADEAAEITKLARTQNRPYLAKCGGTYSSEWFWSKALKFVRAAPELLEETEAWVEVCDWIPATLAGITDPRAIRRSRCAAGHKAMFEDLWGGLPAEEFLAELDPRLNRLLRYSETFESDQVAGALSQAYAEATGLSVGIPIAVGGFDAHFGAVASTARPGTLVKIMGTSTCDCMVHPMDDPLPDVPGMCGIVRGSILPGFYGLEAGQSAVGDIFNWVARFTGQSHEELTAEAEQLTPGQTGLLILDWHNGNRTILVDPKLTGLIVGLTLHTRPAEIYRASIEATAFGARRILDRLREYHVLIERVVACGGITDKSALTMQIYADVLGLPVEIARSEQTCALGAAIFASTVGGAYRSVPEAQSVMARVRDRVYHPDPRASSIYDRLYATYLQLHDSFGPPEGPLAGVMKDLLSLREEIGE